MIIKLRIAPVKDARHKQNKDIYLIFAKNEKNLYL